jgi:Ser/Thr protein kinase RdoA (MazF antagonist)
MGVMNDESSPFLFSSLGPDTVLDALASVGMVSDGRLMALNSYENRVYQVCIEDAPPVITKFYRPARWTDAQILEEHSFLKQLAEAEIPVVAPIETADGKTMQEYGGFRFAVFPRRGGRAPELDRADTLEWLGRFIGRIHAVGATRPFVERPVIDIASFGEEPRAYLLQHGFLPADLRAAYDSVVLQCLQGVRHCFERAGEVTQIRLHGDCHVGNVLWTDAGPHFVDFDDSRTGPAVQDLWMLLSGDRQDMSRQLADMLAGYEDFMEFNERELYLVEAMRTLRLIHYSAWLARRWEDPAFPAAFPWFNTQRYWQDHILALREQVALMDEPPLWGQR